MSAFSKPVRTDGLPRRAVLAAIAATPLASVSWRSEAAPLPANIATRPPVFSF